MVCLFRRHNGQNFYNPRFRNQSGKGKFITFIIVNNYRGFAFNLYFVLRVPAGAAKTGGRDFANFVQGCIKGFRYSEAAQALLSG